MKLEVLELTDTSAKLVISDVAPSFVNAIRRTLLSDIPKMAIENVEFHLGPIRDEHGKEYESVTPLFDEIIAHRLGLIPIPSEIGLFEYRENCDCGGEGCPNCIIMYSLNKKGPSEDDKEDSITVYSTDLQLVKQKVEGVSEKKYTEKFEIKDKIPIVKLNKNQALLLYATAELGTGREHVKWQTAHAVGYRYFPEIEIDLKKCDVGATCVKKCPRNVVRKEKKKIVIKNIEECNLCKACEEICSLDAIKVSPIESKFVFQFETDGVITAKEAFKYALEILKEDFVDMEKLVGKLK
jgi:DNA-directed RNA polymerase subunit D